MPIPIIAHAARAMAIRFFLIDRLLFLEMRIESEHIFESVPVV